MPTRIADIEDAHVRSAVDQIVAFADPIRVVLFGSRARGDHRADSDVDLMVMMPDGTDRKRAAIDIGAATKRSGVGIDLFVVTPDTWEYLADYPGYIYWAIAREHVVVYEREYVLS